MDARGGGGTTAKAGRKAARKAAPASNAVTEGSATKPRTRNATKGGATRARIVAEAAVVFNTRGYGGASLADLMAATGLEKGGIYNHFESKDALAIAAFDHAEQLVTRRYLAALEGRGSAPQRLVALVDAVRRHAEEPPVAGGCPLLNTAVASSGASPELRARARRAMERWRGIVRRIVEDGMAAGELVPGLDADAEASVMLATLEGAVMLATLYRDPVHVQRSADHLVAHVARIARIPAAAAAPA